MTDIAMPLDTKPVNRARRAVLLLFMLLLFLGSVGMAGLLVKNRHKAQNHGFSFDIPAGFETFEVIPQTPHRPVLACSSTDGARQFIIFQLPYTGRLTVNNLVDHAQLVYETYLHVNPTTMADTVVSGVPAIELSGAAGRGFAIATATAQRGSIVILLYRGATPPAPADKALLRQLREEAFRFFGNAQ